MVSSLKQLSPLIKACVTQSPPCPWPLFPHFVLSFFFTLSLEFVFVSNTIIVFVGAGNYICGSARLIRHFPREGEGTHQPNRDGETPDCQLTPTTQWDTDLKYYIIHISYTNNVCWDGDPYTNRVSCCSFDTCCATPGFSLPIKSKLIFPPKTESHHVTCYDDSAPITKLPESIPIRSSKKAKKSSRKFEINQTVPKTPHPNYPEILGKKDLSPKLSININIYIRYP